MKRRRVILFVVLALLLTGAIVALSVATFFSNKKFNWRETYHPNSKEPYGAYITAELLKEKNKGKRFYILERESVKNYLDKHQDLSNATYFSLGYSLFMNEGETKALSEFVSKGNNAFLCLNSLPYNLTDLFTEFECTDYDFQNYLQDSLADLTLLNEGFNPKPTYRYHYIYKNKIRSSSWAYIDSTAFCDSDNNFIALGYIGDGYFNFIKMPYGKGAFYFHSTPSAFSNISMLEKDHLNYFNNVMTYIPSSHIIWDEYHKEFNQSWSNPHSPGPLKFILENISLRWAWYLLLVSIVLFLVFFGKRRQKVIPVMSPPQNTSLEYVNTITELYFKQNDNKSIAQHKMRLFQAFVRNRYYFNSIQLSDEFYKRLSLKSGIQEEEIKTIFATYHLMDQRMTITNSDLINFHRLIEHFYMNCK